jgi:hypothetical protein
MIITRSHTLIHVAAAGLFAARLIGEPGVRDAATQVNPTLDGVEGRCPPAQRRRR